MQSASFTLTVFSCHCSNLALGAVLSSRWSPVIECNVDINGRCRHVRRCLLPKLRQTTNMLGTSTGRSPAEDDSLFFLTACIANPPVSGMISLEPNVVLRSAANRVLATDWWPLVVAYLRPPISLVGTSGGGVLWRHMPDRAFCGCKSCICSDHAARCRVDTNGLPRRHCQ